MEYNAEKRIIDFCDKATIKDEAGISSRPKGKVDIFARTRKDNVWKLFRHKGNLIVYQGREWWLQRILNVPRITGSDDNDLFISWFGLGTGGATIDDPFNPLDPDLADEELANPIVINPSNSNYADGGRKLPFDNVEYLQDPDNDNRWLIARIYVTLPFEEANGVLFNEAGLYISNSNDSSLAATFKLFARYTFSTIEKTEERELLFRWSIYA